MDHSKLGTKLWGHLLQGWFCCGCAVRDPCRQGTTWGLEMPVCTLLRCDVESDRNPERLSTLTRLLWATAVERSLLGASLQQTPHTVSSPCKGVSVYSSILMLEQLKDSVARLLFGSTCKMPDKCLM